MKLTKKRLLRYNLTLEAIKPADKLTSKETLAVCLLYNTILNLLFCVCLEFLADEPGLEFKDELVFEDVTV